MELVFILRTNYFNKPVIWIKRGLKFLCALGFLFCISTIEVHDPGPKYSWAKYSLFVILTAYIFAKPQDELALDKENLHYIKRSIFPFLSRTTKYKISQIKSIGCGGIYDTDTELLIRGDPYRNRLEIIFKDNSSKSHDVTIYKKELKSIVKVVLRLIDHNNPEKCS